MTRVQLYCMTSMVQEKRTITLPLSSWEGSEIGSRLLHLTHSENRIFDLDNIDDLGAFQRALRISDDHDHVIRIVEA